MVKTTNQIIYIYTHYPLHMCKYELFLSVYNLHYGFFLV